MGVNKIAAGRYFRVTGAGGIPPHGRILLRHVMGVYSGAMTNLHANPKITGEAH